MTLGHAPTQADIFRSTSSYCEGRVAPDPIYGLLHRECHRLFPDAAFADLFTDVGRRSVPPMIVAVVMVLQRLEGLSDREATERFSFDVRWKYAAGGLPFDHAGFSHTVLVDMRARLARSARPERIFEVALTAAKEAGLVGRRRVLDSTALYDAVATMDTVTLLRSGIRGLLAAADGREDALRPLLRRDDDYRSGGKPACDWEDAASRDALIDAVARDATALLAALEGEVLPGPLAEAAALLATLLGQDLERDDGRGTFRIARRVAPDRIISTVDADARHGHKTSARSFDGYKGHVALDPDSELVTATAVTPGNAGDAGVAPDLLADDLAADAPADAPLAVYADAAYGSGELLETLEAAGAELRIKVQPPAAQGGRFTKADFAIDLEAATVTCPAGRTAPLRTRRQERVATFGAACAACPLVARCTSDRDGRSVRVGPHEASLARARAARRDPAWLADYRATRPLVERRIAHLMRRRHGGRRARVRGRPKVAADLSLLAAAGREQREEDAVPVGHRLTQGRAHASHRAWHRPRDPTRQPPTHPPRRSPSIPGWGVHGPFYTSHLVVVGEHDARVHEAVLGHEPLDLGVLLLARLAPVPRGAQAGEVLGHSLPHPTVKPPRPPGLLVG